MSRKKVKLAWIVNDRARRSSFGKRKESLLKKVSELATLCGVDAFVIIYGSDNDEPSVWPSRPMVDQLLTRFLNIPEVNRSRKMLSQEAYLKEKIAKMEEQLRKSQKENYERETNINMHQIYQGKPLHQFKTNEIIGMVIMFEEKMRKIQKQIERLERLDPNLPRAGDFYHRRGYGGYDSGMTSGNFGSDNSGHGMGLPHVSLGMGQYENNNAGSSSKKMKGTGSDFRLMGCNIEGGNAGNE